jgi:hypothetical protein
MAPVVQLGAPGPLGTPGITGQGYRTLESLPYSAEKEWILTYTECCTPDDLLSGLQDKAGQCLFPVLNSLGLRPRGLRMASVGATRL